MIITITIVTTITINIAEDVTKTLIYPCHLSIVTGNAVFDYCLVRYVVAVIYVFFACYCICSTICT